MSGQAERLAVAARAAARAVRVGPAGVRVRMPVLGSVEHGTPAAALKGCPCLRCDQLRDRLPLPAGAPALVGQEPAQHVGRVPVASGEGPRSVRAGGGGGVLAGLGRSTVRARVDAVAVERACAGELPAGRLTVSERRPRCPG